MLTFAFVICGALCFLAAGNGDPITLKNTIEKVEQDYERVLNLAQHINSSFVEQLARVGFFASRPVWKKIRDEYPFQWGDVNINEHFPGISTILNQMCSSFLKKSNIADIEQCKEKIQVRVINLSVYIGMHVTDAKTSLRTCKNVAEAYTNVSRYMADLKELFDKMLMQTVNYVPFLSRCVAGVVEILKKEEFIKLCEGEKKLKGPYVKKSSGHINKRTKSARN